MNENIYEGVELDETAESIITHYDMSLMCKYLSFALFLSSIVEHHPDQTPSNLNIRMAAEREGHR